MATILIANRGEIAVRVAQGCRDAGHRAVAVYADPDADAYHVRAADEAYRLEGATLAETYLDADQLLAVARRAGADAVHPCYGFLAERAEFAQAVLDARLTWIGPDPHTIELLGDKVAARDIARRVGAPLVRGSEGLVADPAEAARVAGELGYPVAIKAAFGGGGRGMRVVRSAEEIEAAFASAVRESQAAFGRGDCYLEQYLDRPRHIEAQVIADRHGHVFVLGTRDCSLQRRNQKLVEEAPAPFLTDEQRALVRDSARDLCREAGYVGVGTVEYLLGANGVISFLEVNTRLQVEHTVTEETTGVDLVLAQLEIAFGGEVPVSGDVANRGHAFEFRINAEDVARGFLPSTGRIELLEAPTGPGVRLDTGVRTGSVVTGDYDSMIAKLIVRGVSRAHALRRARRALADLTIDGVTTVLPFHRAVLEDPAFTGEDALGVHTAWIEQEFGDRLAADPGFWPAADAEASRRVRFTVELDGKAVQLGLPAALLRSFGPDGDAAGEARPGDGPGDADGEPEASLRAPMAGVLQRWLVEPGATVSAGEGVCVLEAMKTETTVPAHRDGVVGEASVEAGVRVAAGDALTTIEG